MRYHNPVIPGFYPDPSVGRAGADYYLATSSFEYFPGVPIFHSRDLVNWTQIGHCLTRPSQLNLDHSHSPIQGNIYLSAPGFSGGIYAPTLRYCDGIWYMVTTNVNQNRHFYVTTTDPAGEWSEPTEIDQGDLGSSIDPSLFFDDDGAVYFTGKAEGPPPGIYQFELDIATGKRLTEPRLIWSSVYGKHAEGPHLYKIDGVYYLLVAEGGTEYGHLIAIGRSRNPYGPFELCPHNPILTHRSQEQPIQATGHGDMIQDHRGRWWCVFLGIRPNGYPPAYHLGRETFLAPVAWNEAGWPVIGDNGQVHLTMAIPDLPEVDQPAAAVIYDDFALPELGLQWNFLRHLDPKYWSLAERPGWLRLLGSAVTLDEAKAPTFVGRRQQHFDCRVTTLLDFAPLRDGEEAGLTVYMNEAHHYEIAVTRMNGERCVFVRRRIGSLMAIVAQTKIADGVVKLAITAERDWYHFGYALGTGKPQELARGETRYLSTEVAGGFVGVYFALYATGNGQAAVTPAYFDWLEYG